MHCLLINSQVITLMGQSNTKKSNRSTVYTESVSKSPAAGKKNNKKPCLWFDVVMTSSAYHITSFVLFLTFVEGLVLYFNHFSFRDAITICTGFVREKKV